MIDLLLLAQNSSDGVNAIGVLVFVALYIAVIVGMWKVFVKAGIAGWWSLVPIANLWFLAKICGLPGWAGLLVFVPFAGLLFSCYLTYLLGRAFGKSVPYIVGMILLPFIFVPLLGWGRDEYRGALS
jgi:hypothetical protein